MSVNVYDPVNDTLTPIAGATLYADTPVGFIGAFDAEEVPDGWLIFNGQTVLRSDYPDLWARANRNNQVGVGKFYGIGDGANTFTLADLRETSLKGYGETSRTVGAHVKSGGLGVGEFIDDQLQEHKHYLKNPLNGSNSLWISSVDAANYGSSDLKSGGNDVGNPQIFANTVYDARHGTTTEVKAVGVVWAVKARMTGLPIDLKQEISKAESYSTTEVRTNMTWIDGKPIYRTVIVLPNGTGKQSVAIYTLSNYGITNVDTIYISNPSFYSMGIKTYPFSFYDGSRFSAEVDPSEIQIVLQNDKICNSKVVITLEYTKTTN